MFLRICKDGYPRSKDNEVLKIIIIMKQATISVYKQTQNLHLCSARNILTAPTPRPHPTHTHAHPHTSPRISDSPTPPTPVPLGDNTALNGAFRYPFHPRVTAVARKRPRSSCQKRRWHVTAKTRIHLTYVALHEVTRCMVVWCTQNAPRLTLSGSRFLWHQPCQRCKYTTSVDIQKRAIKTIHSCRITCERRESARERRIALYKSD